MSPYSKLALVVITLVEMGTGLTYHAQDMHGFFYATAYSLFN